MKWESYSHPISDIRDWQKNERLELQPDFQRNFVWSKAAQIMLIDTILKNIPIPKIYIKSIIKNGETYRVVVDGQQRLTAILKFVNNQLALNKPFQGEFQNMKFDDLPDDIKNSILRYKIDINEIFNPNDDEIRDLYARVNKYTVQLNKQELRKADFPGDFMDCAIELSELQFFIDGKVFTVKQRRRMLDVEYVLELLSILMEGVQDKKDTLDYMCEKYQHIEDKGKSIKEKFIDIIKELELIFDRNILRIENTRFNQKADFYSLFSCINSLHNDGYEIDFENIEDIRKSIKMLSEQIAPHSDNEEFRTYAMHCLSDANSINSRKWREKFLKGYIMPSYEKKGK